MNTILIIRLEPKLKNYSEAFIRLKVIQFYAFLTYNSVIFLSRFIPTVKRYFMRFLVSGLPCIVHIIVDNLIT